MFACTMLVVLTLGSIAAKEPEHNVALGVLEDVPGVYSRRKLLKEFIVAIPCRSYLDCWFQRPKNGAIDGKNPKGIQTLF